jgi:hypothetical protein
MSTVFCLGKPSERLDCIWVLMERLGRLLLDYDLTTSLHFSPIFLFSPCVLQIESTQDVCVLELLLY